jgi:hypothetical protein
MHGCTSPSLHDWLHFHVFSWKGSWLTVTFFGWSLLCVAAWLAASPRLCLTCLMTEGCISSAAWNDLLSSDWLHLLSLYMAILVEEPLHRCLGLFAWWSWDCSVSAWWFHVSSSRSQCWMLLLSGFSLACWNSIADVCTSHWSVPFIFICLLVVPLCPAWDCMSLHAFSRSFYLDQFLVFLFDLACWGVDVHGSPYLHGLCMVFHLIWLGGSFWLAMVHSLDVMMKGLCMHLHVALFAW